MRKPYLVVDDRDGRNWQWRLSWYIPEDEDLGGSLGEFDYTELQKLDPDDHDGLAAYRAVEAIEGVEKDSGGFYWDSRGKALAALRIAKAAIKAGADSRPLPDWATKALAAGWKAPKGWKP